MAGDPRLAQAIRMPVVSGILVGHRLIAAGDESALSSTDIELFAGSVLKVRRASGAARIVARELLSRLGPGPQQQQTIAKSSSGFLIWPRGIVGSLAHNAQVAVAAVARQRDFLNVGIDVEPAEAVDAEVLAAVATEDELEQIQGAPLGGRLLFSVKEAIYKAINPIDGIFLDHHDVHVNLKAGTAVACNGRVVPFRFDVADHIVTVAFIPAMRAYCGGSKDSLNLSQTRT
jgi:4'-phosphopantetheinyl transferase EntD